ncbi:hypothetical protein TBK1r_18120 [Stieleria magnilauensis]|uniref:Uncharacterized protein n=1 Tax=Stieleria magnilauensis TaxID=2527963 RepID=A0ABX5XNC2_9BACT|nr:hypothetical protein TBK1r_18120 [Planctomycetes bacterium TBK1r]
MHVFGGLWGAKKRLDQPFGASLRASTRGNYAWLSGTPRSAARRTSIPINSFCDADCGTAGESIRGVPGVQRCEAFLVVLGASLSGVSGSMRDRRGCEYLAYRSTHLRF